MSKSQSLPPEQIAFGKDLVIDTSKRLPQFDNGDALAYEAYSARNKLKKFVAIVSDIENIPRWTFAATYKSMNDVSFIHLVHSDAVFWPPEQKQKFVFAYDGDIGTALVAEGGFGETNWRHPDIVALFIEPMARMLMDMRDKGFCHGSIRPSNIFCFSGNNTSPVVLGDSLSVQTNSTQPALFLPPNKAMTDPMGRGLGSIKDDIYAFGVSLFLFLRKNDELSELGDEEVLRRKVEFGSYSTLIGKERFQASFLELLRGVLYDDETQRWGVEEIFAWLDGVRLTPLSLAQKKKANRPLVFNGKKYLFAELLAVDLYHDPDELVALLEDGTFDRWIRTSIDSDVMVDRYEKALERVSALGDLSKNVDFLVFQITLALNPMLPVRYKGLCFTYDGFGALMAIAAYKEEDLGVFKEVLNLNILDHALVSENMVQAMMLTVINQYDACRAFLPGKKLEQGVERCVYTLCPNMPCLSPKVRGSFVYHPKSVLLTFEALCKQGDQIAIMMDKNFVAFFAARDSSFMNSYLYDFNSMDKNEKISGNLHFMAALQKQSQIDALPAMAGVFLGALSGVYKAYKNIGTRKRVQEAVAAAAQAGDLVAMSSLIDDSDALLRDQNGFRIATGEYKVLQNEYNQYNKKLANKKTYGLTNGHDAATIVSWLVSTTITVIVVLAFISGNRIF